MKSPSGKGILSERQSLMVNNYKSSGFKVLISNNYDEIILAIHEYFKDVRMVCSLCPRRFISYESLKRHIKGFHKRLKEMCIYISMSIIEKVFHYEENEISVIKSKGEIWFRGKDIARN